MPTDRLMLPGYSYLAGPVLDTDERGIPRAFAAAVVLNPFSTALTAFRWTNNVWQQTWFLDREPGFIVLALAPAGQQHLVWLDYAPVPERPGPYGRLLMAQVFGDSVGPIDTVAVMHDQTVAYAAAVSARRRWVAANDNGQIRLFYSDAANAWGELPAYGSAWNGLAVTALDDTTVLVATAAIGPISWGVVRGSTWIGGPAPLPDDYAYSPAFRPRPSGGQWLGWASVDENAGMLTYRDGAWSAPETLRCAHRLPGQHFSDCISLSRDSGEYPAVAWSTQLSASDVVCASMPSDSGFGVAEELENSLTDGCPSAARDANGDVWVAWWRYFGGMYWTHTYTTAMAGAPRVGGAGGHRVLTWTLSLAAPESWWTVQRAGGHAPRRPGSPPRADAEGIFEDVARLRAGDETEMAWTDRSPPAGVLRYRIRRDCVDKRYEWLSDEVSWPPQSRKPRAMRLTARGAALGTELELDGVAPGTFEVGVYDVQGRLVLRQTGVAETDVPRAFHVDLGTRVSRFPAGIYFIRVQDALGRESNAVKTVLLK